MDPILRHSSSDPALQRRQSVRSLRRQSRVDDREDELLGVGGLCTSSSEQSIALLTQPSSVHSTTPIGDALPQSSLQSGSAPRGSVIRSAVRMMSLHRHSSVSSQTSDGRPAHLLLHNVGKTIQRTGSQLRKSKIYHLLYFFMLPAYTFLGALLFRFLDGLHDEDALREYDARCTHDRNDTLQQLHELCRTMPGDACFSAMREFTLKVESCYRAWHAANRTVTHSMHDFNNALIYAFSVYTTIGYGNVAADTTSCRIATIFYGALGIPLFFAFVKEEGNLCRIFFIEAYKKGQRLKRKLCSLCRGKDVLVEASSEPYTNGNCLGVPATSFGPQTENGEVEKGGKTSTRYYKRQYSSNSLFVPDGDNITNERRKVFFAGILVFVLYILIASWVVMITTEFDYITSVYFLFNSVALIGFGDIFPSTPTVILVHAPFMVFGVILFSMCYFIMQEEIRDKAFEASRRARISISKYSQSIINQARSPWSRRNSPLFDNSADGGSATGPSPSTFERMRKRRQSAPAIALTGPTGKTARFRDI